MKKNGILKEQAQTEGNAERATPHLYLLDLGGENPSESEAVGTVLDSPS